MKVSLAWIFDHIDAKWGDYSIDHIAHLFNTTTAEIDAIHKVELPLDQLSMVKVQEVADDKVLVFDEENNIQIPLAPRAGAVKNGYYLIRKGGTTSIWRWATLADIGSATKEGLVPLLSMDAARAKGAWKLEAEVVDYIIEVDNKSLTHRPDMWSHLGFAREIAALLKVPLRDTAALFTNHSVQQHPLDAPAQVADAIKIKVAAPHACHRFVASRYAGVVNRPSSFFIAHRLARIDGRPINAIVDATNYVMFDIGQPMHAFDSRLFADTKMMEVRMAHNDEPLTILDGTMLALTQHDLIISNGKRALGLAGVMGGADTGIQPDTHSIVVEAATFDAAVIRKTATRYKKRTEASARFEKLLDPANTVLAVQRFEKLLDTMNVSYHVQGAIVALGTLPEPRIITVTHAYIETRLGATLTPAFVIDTLTRLGFTVSVQEIDTYRIIVPSWRAGKDITHADDIVEEVGRFYGYATIEPVIPTIPVTVKPIDHLMRLRAAKRYLAYTLRMNEVYNYSLFNETFLQKMNWQPAHTIAIKNPVSAQAYRLVTSLIPRLFENVVEQNAHMPRVRLFEQARVWDIANGISEHKVVSGIWYDRDTAIDFYELKAGITAMFATIGLAPTWHKITDVPFAWYHPYQTAQLMLGDTTIGYVGIVDQQFFTHFATGHAAVFELNWSVIGHYESPVKKMVESSKFQAIALDVSILVARERTVAQLIEAIKNAYDHIEQVQLVDFFEKDEWPDKRSITIRFWINHPERQLTKDDVEQALQQVTHALEPLGGQVR